MRRSKRGRGWWVALGVVAALVFQDPVSGQDREPPPRAQLRGVVVDALSGAPIQGAMVVLDDERRAVLTDSAGIFDLGSVEDGIWDLTARQYGYETMGTVIEVPATGLVELEFPLPPKAVLLDGLEVVTERLKTIEERLESRRRSVALSTRAFGQLDLVRSTAGDMYEFFRLDASLYPESCGRGGFGNVCLRWRGRLIQPRVYIDEMPMIGGFDQLVMYRPYDLYLVEVYSRGREIRIYTHQFMERMARRPMALIPIGLGLR